MSLKQEEDDSTLYKNLTKSHDYFIRIHVKNNEELQQFIVNTCFKEKEKKAAAY